MKVDFEIFPDGRMDTTNTAAYIGHEIHTLAQWRYEKKGPPYVKLGRIYYYKEEVDKWIKSKQVKS